MPIIIDNDTHRPIDAPTAPEPMVLRPIDNSAIKSHYEKTREIYKSVDVSGAIGTGEDFGLECCERNAIKLARQRRHAAIRKHTGG